MPGLSHEGYFKPIFLEKGVLTVRGDKELGPSLRSRALALVVARDTVKSTSLRVIRPSWVTLKTYPLSFLSFNFPDLGSGDNSPRDCSGRLHKRGILSKCCVSVPLNVKRKHCCGWLSFGNLGQEPNRRVYLSGQLVSAPELEQSVALKTKGSVAHKVPKPAEKAWSHLIRRSYL